MQLNQKQTLSHKLILTQSLRQSLRCLQYSAHELNDFVQETALSNPLLEVQSAEFYDTLPIDALSAPPEKRTELYDFPLPRASAPDGAEWSFDSLSGRRQSFTDYLNEQLGQMQTVDNEMRRLCSYLIGCLDRRGYLDCPLSELAEETGCSVSELEQALYAVQMLEPTGVGARDLSECLVLQLAQSKSFNRSTLALARSGLNELARRDYSALSRRLNLSAAEVRSAAEVILSLNPIPSRGFSSEEDTAYITPDAIITEENGTLMTTLNERILPKLSVNADYALLAEQTDDETARVYAREKLTEANALIRDVRQRSDTLLRLIGFLLAEQADFFRGGSLRPVTMQQAAEALAVNVSTVSRAAQNKYLQFGSRIYPLRSLFSAAVSAENGAVSVQTVRQRVSYLIENEDKNAPLSDEAIRLLLEKDGISISRRAVAGHRAALGLPFAGRRRRA